MARFELFGSPGCPHTREMREWLEWQHNEFTEYDVDADPAAWERLLSLTVGQRMIPVLVQDGKVVQVGWQGRACIAGGS